MIAKDTVCGMVSEGKSEDGDAARIQQFWCGSGTGRTY